MAKPGNNDGLQREAAKVLADHRNFLSLGWLRNHFGFHCSSVFLMVPRAARWVQVGVTELRFALALVVSKFRVAAG